MRIRTALGTLVAAALVLLLGANAERVSASVLCANPSKSVFVRDVCKKNEIQLAPATLGLASQQEVAGLQGQIDDLQEQLANSAAFVTGRIKATGLDAYAGAPSGVSDGADGFRTLAPSIHRTARNLAVELESLATADVTVALTPFVGGLKTGNFLLCTVPAGQTTCTSGLSTLSIPAGSSLAIEVFAFSPFCLPSCPAAPPVRFGYEVQ